MHRSLECSTTPSAVVKKQFTGHTAAQGASVQCMHAIEMERSPGLPSFKVTTRRRLMPQGTSCSFLHAVTHALHSMQRSASQRNFMRAMDLSSPYAAWIRHKGLLHGGAPSRGLDLAQRGLRLLHPRDGIEAVGGHPVHAFA